MNLGYEFAMCGCRCDLCKAYRPNAEKNDQREVLAKLWHKYYGLDPSVMECCDGCKNNPSDTGCPVRKCVLAKELRHCGDCGDFPCDVFGQRCGSFSEEAKKGFDMDEYNEYILAYDNKTRLKAYQFSQVGDEALRFLWSRYDVDMVGDGIDELALRDGSQAIVTIRIREGYYDFHVGQGMVRVSDMQSLEEAKQLILAGREPNRKPFPKKNAVYSNCGHRCDLCVHYMENNEALRRKLVRHCNNVYNGGKESEWPGTCSGCENGGLNGKSDCEQKKCAAEKGLEKCRDCKGFGTCKPWASYSTGIGAKRSFSADDITWAILPYMGALEGERCLTKKSKIYSMKLLPAMY